jgi:hypothetical protein
MTPALTIILVVGERRDRAGGALASLLAQDAADRLEVLLFDLGSGAAPPMAATPLIPFYSLGRLAVFALRHRPGLLPQLLMTAPLLFAVQLASAAGHSCGLLFGIGNAEALFSKFEMNEFRQCREPIATGS